MHSVCNGGTQFLKTEVAFDKVQSDCVLQITLIPSVRLLSWGHFGERDFDAVSGQKWALVSVSSENHSVYTLTWFNINFDFFT